MAKRSRYAKSSDPKLVALCHAIEANDAKAVRAAIAAGADPNGMMNRKPSPRRMTARFRGSR